MMVREDKNHGSPKNPSSSICKHRRAAENIRAPLSTVLNHGLCPHGLKFFHFGYRYFEEDFSDAYLKWYLPF
jgi:hypothetical protein